MCYFFMTCRRKNNSFEDAFETEQSKWPIAQTSNISWKQLKKEKKAARKNRKNKKHENYNSNVLTESNNRTEETNDNVTKSGKSLFIFVIHQLIVHYFHSILDIQELYIVLLYFCTVYNTEESRKAY